MDHDVMRILAHADQTRASLRGELSGMSNQQVADLIRTCAGGRLDDLETHTELLVGLLAVVAILELRAPGSTIDPGSTNEQGD